MALLKQTKATTYDMADLPTISMELLMNAIDSNPTTVRIRVNFANFDIVVKDDGAGISNLKHVCQQETISASPIGKYSVRSKALISIARLAGKVEIKTRQKLKPIEQKSIQFDSENAAFVVTRHTSPHLVLNSDSGTVIYVHELFKRLKVRKVSSDGTKLLAQIKKIVERLAIINYRISFHLETDIAEKFVVNPSTFVYDKLVQLRYPIDLHEKDRRYVSMQSNDFRLDGIVQETQKLKLLYVNSFFLKHTALNEFFDKATAGKGYAIWIKVPKDQVDFNYSLTKDYATFKDQDQLIDLCSQALGLETGRPPEHQSITRFNPKPSKYIPPTKKMRIESTAIPMTSTLVKQSPVQWINPVFPMAPAPIAATKAMFLRTTISKDQIKKAKVIGQIDLKFIACKVDNLLFLVDQHAAHERVLLEQYLNNQDADGEVATVVFQRDNAIINEFVKKYQRYQFKLDFSIDILADLMIVQRSFPFKVEEDRFKCIVEKLLQTYPSKNPTIMPTPFLDLFKSKSCRNAIMFGDVLTMTQCQDLVSLLSNCDFPFKCAHGRPTIVAFQ